MRRIHLAFFLLIAVLLAAAVAQAKEYGMPATIGPQRISAIDRKTDVPLRIPGTLNLDYDGKLYVDTSASKRRYEIDLNGAPNCGANVCFLAQITGQLGGSFAFRRKIKLAKGITGRYKPLTCGGSCSPPEIEWKQGYYLYRIQAKIGSPKPRREMKRAANQAIRSGA